MEPPKARQMTVRGQWIVVFAVMALYPLLFYFLYPLIGGSIASLGMIISIVSTLFFGFKIGAVFVIIGWSIAFVMFSQISELTLGQGLVRALVPMFLNIMGCFGADRLALYLKQRKRVETELRESEKKYRLIFESSADGIICLDHDGIIIDASPHVESHLGYTPRELIGTSYRSVGVLENETVKKIDAFVEKASPADTFGTEVKGHHKSGKQIFIDLNISPVAQENRPVEWICMLKDVSERRNMQAQLQQAQKMEAIGRLAGGVAHDINNTLNAIMGSAFALRHEVTNLGRHFEDLDNITSACDRGSQLTRNLLGFARKSNYKKKLFSLNNVVECVLSLLHRTSLKHLQTEMRLADDLAPIDGDQSLIENAVMNLCLNSLDAMSQNGQLTISTFQEGDEVSISVADNGTGMDEEVRRQVFEPFFTTKPVGKGTGLGLSMVYGVMQSHDGKINIDSAPGKGTTVTLTFPKAAVPALREPTLSTLPPPPDSLDILTKREVLIVDDEPLVLRAGARLLRTLGCSVITAGSGKEAVDLVRNNGHNISLVILDLIMPDMDGIATLDELREIDRELPVLLASGYSQDANKIGAIQERPSCGFLPKPYRPDALLAAALKLLKNRAA